MNLDTGEQFAPSYDEYDPHQDMRIIMYNVPAGKYKFGLVVEHNDPMEGDILCYGGRTEGIYPTKLFEPRNGDYFQNITAGDRKEKIFSQILTPSLQCDACMVDFYLDVQENTPISVEVVFDLSKGGQIDCKDFNLVSIKWGEVHPMEVDIKRTEGMEYYTIDLVNWTDKLRLNFNFGAIISGAVTCNIYAGEGNETEYPPLGPPPSVSENFVMSRTYQNEMRSYYAQELVYHDNLGRPFQKNNTTASPSGNDIITHSVYDKAGRLIQEWLAVSSKANGYALPLSQIQSLSRTYYGDQYPYSRTDYEQSPMAKINKTYLPGSVYHNESHYRQEEYKVVSSGVVRFTLKENNSANNVIVNDKNEDLYVISVTDEDGGKVETFYNLFGQKILERQQDADIYYIYDLRGNLRVVFPPISAEFAVNGDVPAALDHAYQYLYDENNRCVDKKYPDADWEYLVYDKADRLVAMQNAYWRSQNRWQVYTYDAHNRLEGEWRSQTGKTRTQMEAAAATTNGSAASMFGEFRTAWYVYDTYPEDGKSTGLTFSAVTGVAPSYNSNLKGLLTCSEGVVVGSDAIEQCTETRRTLYYYDDRGQMVQSVSRNHLGGISRTSFRYDFVGKVTAKHESHQPSATAAADILLTYYSYDHAGRLLSETTTLNGGGKAVIRYGYDETGRLASRSYGEGNNAVIEDYHYNVQGWLTTKKSDIFEMTLRYYDPLKTQSTQMYTGNISEWEWKHKQGTTNLSHYAYGFSYDRLGRLTDSRLYENDGASPVNKFTEKDLTYVKNGNVKTLKRYSSTAALPDNFTYNYTGNQLTSLSGSLSANYSYDGMGNMTRERHREHYRNGSPEGFKSVRIPRPCK